MYELLRVVVVVVVFATTSVVPIPVSDLKLHCNLREAYLVC